jgi:hypothetical protein
MTYSLCSKMHQQVSFHAFQVSLQTPAEKPLGDPCSAICTRWKRMNIKPQNLRQRAPGSPILRLRHLALTRWRLYRSASRDKRRASLVSGSTLSSRPLEAAFWRVISKGDVNDGDVSDGDVSGGDISENAGDPECGGGTCMGQTNKQIQLM